MHYIAFPLVATHPTDTSAAAPFSALFKCSIQAYGYLTVTWYRSNTYPVPEKAYSTLIPSVNVTTSILTIPNVTSEDIGTYCCKASISRITVKSLNANLFHSGIMHCYFICNIYSYRECIFRSTFTTSGNDYSFSKPYC